MDIRRDLPTLGPVDPPLASIRRLSKLTLCQMAAACRTDASEIWRVEKGKMKGKRLTRVAWLSYLLWIRTDAEFGWIRACLNMNPSSPICTIPKEELLEILRKLKAPMSKAEIDEIYSSDDH